MSLIQVLLRARGSTGRLLPARLRGTKLKSGSLLLFVALRHLAAAGSWALVALSLLRVTRLTVATRRRLLLVAFLRADLLRRRVVVALGARRRVLLLGYPRQLRATAGIRHAHVSQIDRYTVSQLRVVRFLFTWHFLLAFRALAGALLEAVVGLVRAGIAAAVVGRLRDGHAWRYLDHGVRQRRYRRLVLRRARVKPVRAERTSEQRRTRLRGFRTTVSFLLIVRRRQTRPWTVRLRSVGTTGLMARGERQRARASRRTGGDRRWTRRSGQRRQRYVAHGLPAIRRVDVLRGRVQLVLETVEGARALIMRLVRDA